MLAESSTNFMAREGLAMLQYVRAARHAATVNSPTGESEQKRNNRVNNANNSYLKSVSIKNRNLIQSCSWRQEATYDVPTEWQGDG